MRLPSRSRAWPSSTAAWSTSAPGAVAWKSPWSMCGWWKPATSWKPFCSTTLTCPLCRCRRWSCGCSARCPGRPPVMCWWESNSRGSRHSFATSSPSMWRLRCQGNNRGTPGGHGAPPRCRCVPADGDRSMKQSAFELFLDGLDPEWREHQLGFFRIMAAAGPDAVEELAGRVYQVSCPAGLKRLALEFSYYFPWPEWSAVIDRILKHEKNLARSEE